ncbi:hypothetical protein TomTYG45_06100 [Sphingobium sp. TomTYG45]
MQLTTPDFFTMERIRRAALVELNKRGLASAEEMAELADAHLDDVLDHLFLHCGKLRVRITRNRYIEVHPGRTMQ